VSGIASLVRRAALLAGLILVVWLLLFLVGANTGNPVVSFFQAAADWLATWSRGLFDNVGNRDWHATLVYGIPALVYLGGASVLGYGPARREP
jgi:hypothetical protein